MTSWMNKNKFIINFNQGQSGALEQVYKQGEAVKSLKTVKQEMKTALRENAV